MNTFEQITIEGFQRLFSVSVDMRPLTVMIGANGVGKTAFLEMFSLLAASANGQLQSKISELGGLSEMVTRDKADNVAISLSMPDSRLRDRYAWDVTDSFKYHLQLGIKGQFYELSREILTHQFNNSSTQYIDAQGGNVKYYEQQNQSHRSRKRTKEKLVSPNWEHNLFETLLYQIPKNYSKSKPEILRKTIASCAFYKAWELNVAPKSPVRLPQPMRPAILPGANGEDLVSCLFYLRETDSDRFEIIEDTLSVAFPDFERLNFPPVAAGTLAMTWKDKNFSQPLYMHQLSEGTLRFLWLVTLLQSRDLTAVTLIDEPEVSLHPELLKLLADVMREAAQRTQLVVATHSDRLIRFLEPNEVLVCDAEEGLTTMTWADSLDLEKWLADYSLDELWAMNVIGGRP
jgi:predicted ATPase